MPDLHQPPPRGKAPAPSSRALAKRSPPPRTKLLALFIAPDDAPPPHPHRPPRSPGPAHPLAPKLPDRPLHLAFKLLPGLPDTAEELQARTHWLGHLRTHAGALAALAVDRTEGETRERATLVAERLAALLQQATTATYNSIHRLDLAAPLPEVKPWPPLFAGEPPSPTVEHTLATTLNWHNVNDVARWARLLAYLVSGLHDKAPSPLQAIAIVRLRRLLNVATRGLMTGLCAAYVSLHTETAPPAAAPAKKSRRKKAGAR